MKQIIIILLIMMVGCKEQPQPNPTIQSKHTCSNIHGSDQYGDYIVVDTIKVYGMMDECNDSGCGD